MFGEFTDDAPKVKQQDLSAQQEEQAAGAASLVDRMALHLAGHTDVVLKSQQRGEPELSTREKVLIVSELLHKSQAQFMYRFGRFLELEHLRHFENAALTDPVLAHYVTEARNKLDTKKSKILVRNRRWAAVQKAGIAPGGVDEDYFTETAMKQRNPLLYQQLVGQHLTDDEKRKQNQEFDSADCRISTIIFDHLDRCDERVRKSQQEEQEDDMFEEEEEEDDDEDGESEAMEDDCDEASAIDDTKKALLRGEFMSSMYSTFVTGKDESFDYKTIDENDEYDLLDIENHDKEEKYFDDEEPCEVSEPNSRNSPMLPEMCLDRRLLTSAQNSAELNIEQASPSSTSISQTTTAIVPPATDLLVADDMPPVESLSLT